MSTGSNKVDLRVLARTFMESKSALAEILGDDISEEQRDGIIARLAGDAEVATPDNEPTPARGRRAVNNVARAGSAKRGGASAGRLINKIALVLRDGGKPMAKDEVMKEITTRGWAPESSNLGDYVANTLSMGAKNGWFDRPSHGMYQIAAKQSDDLKAILAGKEPTAAAASAPAAKAAKTAAPAAAVAKPVDVMKRLVKLLSKQGKSGISTPDAVKSLKLASGKYLSLNFVKLVKAKAIKGTEGKDSAGNKATVWIVSDRRALNKFAVDNGYS